MKISLKILSAFMLMGALTFSACDFGGGKNTTTDTGISASSLFANKTSIAAGTECAAGGVQIDMGFDVNQNSTLDSDEITKTEYVCNGTNGTNGSTGATGAAGTNGTDASSHPFVVYTSPAAADTGVSLTPVISVVFNTEMNSASILVNGAFTVKDESEANVAGTVAYTGIIATFTPTSALLRNTKYSINISSSVTNVKGIALGYNQQTYFTAKGYVIGETGPSGVGIVFYVTDGGLHGLEAAPAGWAGGTTDPISAWITGGTTQTTLNGNTDTYIGSGLINSKCIIWQGGSTGSAAKLCRDYIGGGKADWFLPSREELELLYLQKAVVGGFGADDYWSSSEYDAYGAWTQNISYGNQNCVIKNNDYYVRAIRAF